ncbi:MAG TPA: hypothetical protein VEB42_08380, partial [Chitinophagaceae bacterium]|nr:hypothetical protein [Chitinophagaceae bacterium]
MHDRFEDQYLARINNFSHNFPDTKYRQVRYQLKAFSKFRDLFNDIDREDELAVTFESSLPVLNSSRPKAPRINKIIPVFTWIEKNGVRSRVHDRFRVYFDDDEWYTTGANEGIAVIVMKNDSDNAGKNTIDEHYSSIFSQLGADPIQGLDSIPSLKTSQFSKDSLIKNSIQYNEGRTVPQAANGIQARDTIVNDRMNAAILSAADTTALQPVKEGETATLEKFNYVVYPVF